MKLDTEIHTYTPGDLLAVLDKYAKNLRLRGTVTGVSSIAPQSVFATSFFGKTKLAGTYNTVGFVLDNNFFLNYTGDLNPCCLDTIKGRLSVTQASAWLEQNKGREIYVTGEFEPESPYHLQVRDFFKDPNFRERIFTK